MGERGLIIMIETITTIMCGIFFVVVVVINPIYMYIRQALHEYHTERDKEK